MTVQTHAAVEQSTAAEHSRHDSHAWEALSATDDPQVLCRAWIGLVVRQFDTIETGLILLKNPCDGAYVPAAFWPDAQTDLSYLTAAAQQALVERRGVEIPPPHPSGHAQVAIQHRLEFSTGKSKRQQELFQDKFTSANDYEEAKTAKSLAEAELTEANGNKQLARLELRENEDVLRLKTLLSPFSGVVMERLHHPGEVTQPDDTSPVLKLAEIDPLNVEIVLPVAVWGKLQVGDTVAIGIEALGSATFKATVKVVDRVVDAASGTFGVRLELRNPEGRIPAGVRCQAHLKF